MAILENSIFYLPGWGHPRLDNTSRIQIKLVCWLKEDPFKERTADNQDMIQWRTMDDKILLVVPSPS